MEGTITRARVMRDLRSRNHSAGVPFQVKLLKSKRSNEYYYNTTDLLVDGLLIDYFTRLVSDRSLQLAISSRLYLNLITRPEVIT